MNSNIILSADSYKYSMWNQSPPGTEYQYSYIESRGGLFDRVLFFGLQMYLKEYLSKPISMADIDEAEEIILAHGEPFYREGWEYILNKHGGYLPLAIDAVPEGTVLPVKNVVATVVNTDPKAFWLTSFIETSLLRAIWYPSTVATVSYMAKQMIMSALRKSADDPEAHLPWRLADFGARGVSSTESAGLGGAAHLVNFLGSDTVTGLVYARRYYGEHMAGFSVPAMEHSTVCSWGRDGEVAAYENMLNQYAKPGAIVACVSDAYDIDNAVENIWGDVLRQQVIDSGATLVIRPDSGPTETAAVKVVEQAAASFGYTINTKGYKVLATRDNGVPIVRVIHGDGISLDTIPVLLENLMAAGYSAENLVLGMGGNLLQNVNRDTMRWAMKCSAVRINDEWMDVFKDPVTDPGKRSKRGRLALVHEAGEWQTVPADGNGYRNRLELVFRDGQIMRDWSFTEVRAASNR